MALIYCDPSHSQRERNTGTGSGRGGKPSTGTGTGNGGTGSMAALIIAVCRSRLTHKCNWAINKSCKK
jgi:hypothetical protein